MKRRSQRRERQKREKKDFFRQYQEVYLKRKSVF